MQQQYRHNCRLLIARLGWEGGKLNADKKGTSFNSRSAYTTLSTVERLKRTEKRLCVLGKTGILLQLACFVLVRFSITVFWSVTNGKTCLKEGEVLVEVFFFELNYCHVFSQNLSSYLLYRFIA